MAARSDLMDELARPGRVGVRNAWVYRPLAALTPSQVADVLRRASQGDSHDFLVAAADVEEKDLHYRAVLQTRKLAVAGLPLVVSAADDSELSARAADLVRDQFAGLDMVSVNLSLMDAVAKGYSVAELVWETSGKAWRVARVLPREPQWFTWDRDTGRVLRLADGSLDGSEVPPYKFLLHAHGSGIPVMCGIARSALWAWVFKSFAMRDWAAFCEVFGQPVRLGKYDASASKDDVDVLKRAVMDVGSDCAAVLPRSMAIEIVESASKTASADLYARLIDYLDAQVSKCVLGQTLTTDSGTTGGLAQARVHEEVRSDLIRFDSMALSCTLRWQLAEPVVRLNLGDAAKVPLVSLHVDDQEDLSALHTQVVGLAQAGLAVPVRWVRDKWGIPEPESGEDVLSVGAVAAMSSGSPALGGGGPVVELQTERMAVESGRAWSGVLDQVRSVVDGAESLEGLRDALLGSFGDLDAKDLRDVMAMGFAAASLAGRFGVMRDG